MNTLRSNALPQYKVSVTAVRVRDRRVAVVSVEHECISDAWHAAIEQLNTLLGHGQWRVVCRDEAASRPTAWRGRVPLSTADWNVRDSIAKW